MCEDITWEKNPQDVDEWFVRLWLLFRWLWLTCRQNSPKKNKGQKPRRLQPSPNWFHRLQELAPLHFFRGGSEFFFFFCFTVTVLLLSFILSLQGSVDEPVQWLSGQKYCSIYELCLILCSDWSDCGLCQLLCEGTTLLCLSPNDRRSCPSGDTCGHMTMSGEQAAWLVWLFVCV